MEQFEILTCRSNASLENLFADARKVETEIDLNELWMTKGIGEVAAVVRKLFNENKAGNPMVVYSGATSAIFNKNCAMFKLTGDKNRPYERYVLSRLDEDGKHEFILYTPEDAMDAGERILDVLLLVTPPAEAASNEVATDKDKPKPSPDKEPTEATKPSKAKQKEAKQ